MPQCSSPHTTQVESYVIRELFSSTFKPVRGEKQSNFVCVIKFFWSTRPTLVIELNRKGVFMNQDRRDSSTLFNFFWFTPIIVFFSTQFSNARRWKQNGWRRWWRFIWSLRMYLQSWRCNATSNIAGKLTFWLGINLENLSCGFQL